MMAVPSVKLTEHQHTCRAQNMIQVLLTHVFFSRFWRHVSLLNFTICESTHTLSSGSIPLALNRTLRQESNHAELSAWARDVGVTLPPIGHNEIVGPGQTLLPASNLALISSLEGTGYLSFVVVVICISLSFGCVSFRICLSSGLKVRTACVERVFHCDISTW
jgi:hypothetical protein